MGGEGRGDAAAAELRRWPGRRTERHQLDAAVRLRRRTHITLAGGADVLVHESLDLGWYEQQGRSPAFLDYLEESHVAATEVGKIAHEAEVRTLVLSHLGPAANGTVTDGQWQSMAEQGITGTVIVAEDLQRVRG